MFADLYFKDQILMRRSLEHARIAIYGCQTELRRIRATFPETYLPHAAITALSLHADEINKALAQLDAAEKYPLAVGEAPIPRWPVGDGEALEYLTAIRAVRRTRGIVEMHLTRYQAKVEKKAAKKARKEERRRHREFLRLGRQLRAARAKENEAALERLREAQAREVIDLVEESEETGREKDENLPEDSKEAEANGQGGEREPSQETII